MQTFLLNLISLNYKSIDLIDREKVIIYDTELDSIIFNLKTTFNIEDIFIISTCNRTELYYRGENADPISVLKYLLLIKNLRHEDYISRAKILTGNKTLVYFFKMALGLESQVPGDIQLINQVKKAYKDNIVYQDYSPQMHRLMHLIFYTNKQVANQTEFKTGSASISYSVIQLIKTLFKHPQGLNILVVGLGDIGTDIAKNLVALKPKTVTLANRTKTKAVKLARELNFSSLDLEDIETSFRKVDVLISSLSVKTPFFKFENVEHSSSLPCCLIDLSLPRSIDENFKTIDGVSLYNLDDINAQIAHILNYRRQEIPKILKIIDQNLSDFHNWVSEMSFTPTIQKFKKCLEQIRIREINKRSNQLTQEQIESVEIITKAIMNKIIKLPVVQIKSACKREEADSFVEALVDLFDLERIKLDQQV